MELFNVYPLFDIEPEKAEGSYLWDTSGTRYLDLYGGHAVISIGHSHPHYVKKISDQLQKIGFYSNSVQIPGQKELASKLGELSGKDNFRLFLCNSGAEANENAMKAASFHTKKKKIISFTNGFHGRTSLAVAVTDNDKITAPVNETDNAHILPFNDIEALERTFARSGNEVAAAIIEGIQGIGGIYMPDKAFAKRLRELCDQYNVMLIADSVQCGYGRSGKFFSHDYLDIEADIYTMAKGMGNGFPLAGVLIHPKIEAWPGMLGTTFGGNHLACAAGIAVLDVMKEDGLMDNALHMEKYIRTKLEGHSAVKEIRGKGLMLGIELDREAAPVRKKTLMEHQIFTGASNNKYTIRLLPALNVKEAEIDMFLEAFNKVV